VLGGHLLLELTDKSYALFTLLGFRLDTWTNVSSILALLNLHDSLVVINGKLSGVDKTEERQFVQARAYYRRTRVKAMKIRDMFERSLDLSIDGETQPKSVWKYITQVRSAVRFLGSYYLTVASQNSLVHMLASLHVYQEESGREPGCTARWKFWSPQTVAFLQTLMAMPPLGATIEEMYKVKIAELKGRAHFD
jgi:hypothetical protein